MTEWWQKFEQFLATDPRDIGCDEAMGIMHVYVDLLAEGIDPIVKYPGMAAHLSACEPCAEDVRGLLAVVRDGPDVTPL
jgi:hypothetical protein